jgi:hypothetical protein
MLPGIGEHDRGVQRQNVKKLPKTKNASDYIALLLDSLRGGGASTDFVAGMAPLHIIVTIGKTNE